MKPARNLIRPAPLAAIGALSFLSVLGAVYMGQMIYQGYVEARTDAVPVAAPTPEAPPPILVFPKIVMEKSAPERTIEPAAPRTARVRPVIVPIRRVSLTNAQDDYPSNQAPIID